MRRAFATVCGLTFVKRTPWSRYVVIQLEGVRCSLLGELPKVRINLRIEQAVFFSLQSLCLMHTGKPTGVAVSHCITWFQTQLILTACQIRYHSHCGIIVALDSSEP